jgi:hypothetical protein
MPLSCIYLENRFKDMLSLYMPLSPVATGAPPCAFFTAPALISRAVELLWLLYGSLGHCVTRSEPGKAFYPIVAPSSRQGICPCRVPRCFSTFSRRLECPPLLS